MTSLFHRSAECREPAGPVGEDGRMPLREALAATATALAGAAGTLARGVAATARGVRTAARWAARTTGRLRAVVAGGETGMIRMFDLHAASIAGDTLITVGLAGTIFFTAPLGEARNRVALYLVVTMVPFALLAPLIGPLLDRFRHGRRYALASTMLGRAMLAWMIAGQLDSVALYPAVFGVLVLSRAYGVARAAAVPRLLPTRLGLSQVNARGSFYGTAAGAAVLPLGMAAYWFGPQWPLRVAAAIFLVGMVLALRLPARADADPPEAPPPLLRRAVLRLVRNGPPVITGRLLVNVLAGSAGHRLLYGFLLVFLAFTIRAPGQVSLSLAGRNLSEGVAIGLVSGALVAGTFLAVAAGSRLRIHQPLAVQAVGLACVAAAAVAATAAFTLPALLLLCVVTAVSTGLAKVAVDSSLQERVAERYRTTAFARSETLLMLAFVAGGGLGLVPVPGRWGVGAVAVLSVLAAGRTAALALALRRDRLRGRPAPAPTSDRRPVLEGGS
jgi:hypothetical protein